MSQAQPEQVVDLEEEEEEEEEECRILSQDPDGSALGGRIPWSCERPSDSETDVASEELGPPLVQQFENTEGTLPSSLSAPTLRPEDIEFPDLLRWVARNSNFDATSPPAKSDEEVLFESEVRPDPRDSDFYNYLRRQRYVL